MGGMGLGSHGLACSGRMLKGGEGSGSARGVVEGAVRKEWVPGKATACGGGGCVAMQSWRGSGDAGGHDMLCWNQSGHGRAFCGHVGDSGLRSEGEWRPHRVRTVRMLQPVACHISF